MTYILTMYKTICNHCRNVIKTAKRISWSFQYCPNSFVCTVADSEMVTIDKSQLKWHTGRQYSRDFSVAISILKHFEVIDVPGLI